ncbi:MAG: Uma2 family endonuclease [Oscillospiraceae bacterium]|nr:Uma2 family endonuclease [Oscillospiraceae bacterium]
MKKELEPFSLRIKSLRNQRRLKQSDIAEFLDCTERHYQRIEHGEVNIPLKTLIALADFFGVTTDYLLGYSDKGGPPAQAKRQKVMSYNKKRLTYQDYCDISGEDRCELIDGELYMMETPLMDHVLVSSNLLGVLGNFLAEKPCRILHAPIDVFLFNQADDPESTIECVVEPDLIVLCDPKQIGKRGIFGPPKLVIEILSEVTLKRDREIKFNLYQQAGVAEYWIVNPRNSTIIIFTLENENYYVYDVYTRDEILHSAVFPDLSIELPEIFAEW